MTDAIDSTAIAPEPGVPKPDPILVARGITRTFGGLLAVNVDHLEVQRNTITALIGPNGAGKTTLFNLLTGFDKPDHGAWRFGDHELAGTPPYKIARLGMVRTFQLTKSLSRLTVLDNMLLGAPNQRGERFLPGLFQVVARPGTREHRSRTSTSSNDSTWSPSATTPPARCRAASASCWRWRAR